MSSVPDVIAGLTPALDKAAIAAATRASGFAIDTVRERAGERRTKSALRRVEAEAFWERASKLTPSEAAALVDYAQSPDFLHVAFVIASSHTSRQEKTRSNELTRAKELLAASLRLHVGVASSRLAPVVDALMQELIEAVSAARQTLALPAGPTAQARAAHAKTAAGRAKAIVRNCELLRAAGNLRQYAVFEEDMRGQVRSLHSGMRLPHAGTNKLIRWNRLYVRPRLQVGQGQESNEHSFDAESLLSRSVRLTILGDPGGGKSTLSQKLAFDVASGNAKWTAATLPLFVVLREAASSFQQKITVADYLESLCRFPHNIEPPDGAIEYALLNGRAFVIFDGLDELLDTSFRSQVTKAVEAFAYRYPTTPILVTSRRIGYEQAPLDPDLFPAVRLADFTQPQVAEYAKRWFSLDESHLKHERENVAAAFLRESQLVADLRTNPLLLSLMCGIYAAENYIPRNRPEIYEKCALMLFDRWDKQRGITVALSFDAHVKSALRSLALWLYEDPARQEGLTRERLVDYMTSYLYPRRFEEVEEAENAATEFIDFCTGRAWVLTDVGATSEQALYAFTHRTFLEYFAANQLFRTHSEPASLLQTLLPRIEKSEWDVVCQLALQILASSVEDGGDRLLASLIEHLSSMPEMDDRRPVVASFAARSLAYIVPSPTVLRNISDAAFDAFLASPTISSSDHTPGLRAIADLLQASIENAPTIERALQESATSVMSSKHRSRVLALMTNLDHYGALGRSLPREVYRLQGHSERWSRVATSSRSYYASELTEVARTEPWAAMMEVELGRLTASEAVSRFGAAPLFDHNLVPGLLRVALAPRVLFELAGSRVEEDLGPSALGRISEELADALPAAPLPWIPPQPLGAKIIFSPWWAPQLETPDQPRLTTFLLVSLALIEDEVDEFGHRPRFSGRGMNQFLAPFLAARIDASRRKKAVAVLDEIRLPSRADELARGWVSGEIDLVAGRRGRSGRSSRIRT